MTRLILVRHAQSMPSSELPESDWPLSALGQDQAAALAPVLAELGVDALASSPYRRAIETLRPFAEAAGLPIAVDPDLRERALGGWLENPTEVEDAVRRMHADLEFCLPGGETGLACLARFRAALGRAIEQSDGAIIAVGSHGGVLSHLLASLEAELPAEFWRRIRNPHLFIFETRPALRLVGERTLDGAAGVKSPTAV